MPDLWDTNPDHVFGTPGEEPDPAPSGRDEHPKVVLTDHTGRLGLPTYVLIMLVVVLAATVLLTVALLVAPT